MIATGVFVHYINISADYEQHIKQQLYNSGTVCA